MLAASLAAFFMLQPLEKGRAAPAATTLASDADARWVPFELTRHNQIRFAMTLNGRPATAILDTGMTDSVVSQAFAAAAGLKPGVAGTAEAIGGRVAIRWAATKAMTLAGLSRSGGRIAVADLAALGGGGATSADLLIGSDVLACCALDIDYDARRFRLLPSGRLPFRGATAPLRVAEGSNAWMTELDLGGRRLRPILVDTGDGAAVTLARGVWAAAGFGQPATTTIAYGLGGPVVSQVAIVPALALPGLAARDVEVRIEGEDGFSARTGSAGRIGTGFLRVYRVLLDPRAGRLLLAPGNRAAAPPLRSTSGLLLGYEGDRLRVLHVMANSPAAAGGWKQGETICQVDGAAVPASVSADGLTAWSVGAPGRVVKLGLCDGSERDLTLRNFY